MTSPFLIKGKRETKGEEGRGGEGGRREWLCERRIRTECVEGRRGKGRTEVEKKEGVEEREGDDDGKEERKD